MKKVSMLIISFTHIKPFTITCLIAAFSFFVRTSALCQQFNVDEWKFESQRKAIEPVAYIDSTTLFNNEKTLAIKGAGKDYADGHWYNEVSVEPGKYFQFRSYFTTTSVDEPHRSIVTRILWENAKGEQVGYTEYPAMLTETRNGWKLFEETYKIPADATKAKLELHYRWDADGTVHFADVSFKKTDIVRQRMVRVATINYRPRNSKSSVENLQKFSSFIEKAAAQKADIVCLPEESTLAGTDLNYVSASEPVPGPTTEFLGGVAKKYNLYIVAGLLEKDGDVVFLHKLQRGKASKSYGIAVARLAGLPQIVIERAKSVLEKLEKYELAVFADESKHGIQRAASMKAAAQVSLFAISNENVLDELRSTDVASLSGDEAKRVLEDAKKRLV